jgi:hypothetical protein
MDSYPQAPATAQDLDELMYRIDSGQGTFASLSDEQREQLKADLADDWLTEYLQEYPVPADLGDAIREYRDIESGDRYASLPPNVRADLLLLFDEHHGEGGPDQWAAMQPD